jgi:hypothetical protein
MPQPLQLRSDEGKKIIHGTEALEQRPVLATAIAVVCVHWNRLEQTLARMFIAALGGRERAALAIYNTLIDRRLKAATFKAIAAASMSKEMQGKADALFTSVNSVSKRRNKIVHGVWAAIDSKPQSLLLRDQAQMNNLLFALDRNRTLRMENVELQKRGAISYEEWQKRLVEMQSEVVAPATYEFMEYKEHDFREVNSAITELNRKIDAYTTELYETRV